MRQNLDTFSVNNWIVHILVETEVVKQMYTATLSYGPLAPSHHSLMRAHSDRKTNIDVRQNIPTELIVADNKHRNICISRASVAFTFISMFGWFICIDSAATKNSVHKLSKFHP